MQQQSEIPDPPVEAEKVTDGASVPHGTSPILKAENCSSANHTLGVRIGGWIASFFSWYRY